MSGLTPHEPEPAICIDSEEGGGGPPLIGLIVGAVGLPAALATVSLLAAVAAGLSLYATPQRALLHARLTGALDAGRERAVAGLTPACCGTARRSAASRATWPCSAPPGPDRPASSAR